MATTYKVTYNANGGDASSVPAAQTKQYGVTLTLSNKTPKRSGCVFYGWDTKANGTGTHYSPGDPYTANASITLYAMWLGVDLPSYTVLRTNAQGQEADEGAYGTLNASWTAVGTLAATVRVTAQNVTSVASITLSGNTSGTVTPGETSSGSVSATFGGNLGTDTRYLIRVFVEANTTSPYAGQTRTVYRYFEAYVDVAYITIDVLAGGHGVAFGNPASQEGFHCHMPATFHDVLTAPNIGALVTNDISAVGTQSGSWKSIGSVTLTAGVWVVEYNATFNSNANGKRAVVLSTSTDSAGSTGEQRYGMVTQQAVSGMETRMGHMRTIAYSGTFNLNVYQDSGSAIWVTGFIRATRIK